MEGVYDSLWGILANSLLLFSLALLSETNIY